MRPDLNIELLRTFVTVAETGGFKRAGEILFLSQSAVSIKIKKLEDLFGKKLLDRRQGRLVGLTEEGAHLIDCAREMLRLNDMVFLSVTDPDLAGTVQLGLPEDFIEQHLPLVLARFAKSHPRVRLDVRCDLSRMLIAAVHNGNLDAALIKQAPGRGSGIPLFKEPLVWVGAPIMADAFNGTLPLVLFSEGCAYREQVIMVLNQAGLDWRVVFTSASLSGIQAAVLGGMGISVLPKSIARGLPLLDDSNQLPALPESELALVMGKRKSSDATRKLVDCICRYLEVDCIDKQKFRGISAL